MDTALAIVVDDRTYSLRLGSLTAADAQALRRATGMSLRAVVEAAAEDPDIDVFAALVWLSRRAAGERALAYEAVAGEITYESSFGTAEPVAEGESDPSS